MLMIQLPGWAALAALAALGRAAPAVLAALAALAAMGRAALAVLATLGRVMEPVCACVAQ